MNSISQLGSKPSHSVRSIPFDQDGRFPIARWAPIPLRLIVGYGFMAHGFAKLSRGPDAFANILHAVGVPAAHFMAWLTILTEIFGGLAILLGAFVTLVSLPMAAVLLVAMFRSICPTGSVRSSWWPLRPPVRSLGHLVMNATSRTSHVWRP
jgi:uncharacterized membrane protein YphA (DoxX/SURF4 family)